jgi:iron complex transport system substrate-binding protein
MAGSFEPNLEAIAAARPDLIVDAWADEAIHGALSRIAPTIEIKLDNTDSWQAAQRLAGEATGAEQAAEVAIGETEDVLAAQAARLAALTGMSVAVAFIVADELVIIPGNEIGGRILTELGLTVHPTPDGVSGRYSVENLVELVGDADVIVSYDYGNLSTQEADPLFRQLPAVQAGRYVAIDAETATACYQESTLSMRWAAGRLADALLA